MISTQRRSLLKVLTGSALALMLTPIRSFAVWSSRAFNATSLDDALLAAYGSKKLIPSDQIELKIARLAENGAQVPVDVSTTLEKAESISLFAKDNPRPYLVSFKLQADTLPEISTRIRLAKSTQVYAVVSAEGKRYMTQQSVQVTIGGCGG